MKFLHGDIADHDDEVDEVRWAEIDETLDLLAFRAEKQVLTKAKEMIS
jgi:NADH pyrophosphatase NudC (nudix superfamily)